MLSDILRKDIRQYAARGIAFEPADIVRLNALAVRVKLCQRPCQGVHLPRCVFLPPTSIWGRELVLREPTVAHELWLEESAQWIDVADERNFLFLHAYALSFVDPAKLPDAFAPKRLIRKVFMFAAKRLARYTTEQLRNAVDYALYGADWTAGEFAEECKIENGKCKTEEDTSILHSTFSTLHSPTLGLIDRARALRLPIALDDAMRMTASELAEAVNHAAARDGDFDAKAARHDAMGDYVRTRDAIAARIEREKTK